MGRTCTRFASTLVVALSTLVGTSFTASATVVPVMPGAWGTLATTAATYVEYTNYLPSNPYLANVNTGSNFAVDGGGNAYTANYSGSGVWSGIQRYSPATGSTTILDPGLNTSAMQSIAVTTAGIVYVIVSNGSIYEINQSGSPILVAPPTNFGYPTGLAVDGAGNLFVTYFYYGFLAQLRHSNLRYVSIPSWTADTSQVVELAGGSWQAVATNIDDVLGHIAVAPSGTVYVDSNSGSGSVYSIDPTSGAVTTINGPWSYAEGLAADSAGNLFVADEGGTVYQVSPTGSVSALPPSPSMAQYGYTYPDELSYSTGVLYLWDEYPYQYAHPPVSELYTWGVGSVNAPVATSVSSVARVDSVYQQSVTATWLGTGATSYRCTLMYGFSDPSPFTVTTPSTSCTFTNLALGQPFGISVVAINGSSVSRASVTFATPAKFTITCVRAGHVRHVTGTDPRCPGGWRQR